MHTEEKNESKNRTHAFGRHALKKALWILGIAVAVLLIFKFGEFVGYHKAEFSYRLGERYYEEMGGVRSGFPGFGDGDFLMSHGTLGSIISIASSSFVVQDDDNMEKTVLIGGSAAIRSSRMTIAIGDLKTGERVIVVGDPTANGEISAKLVRVMPPAMQRLPGSSASSSGF